MALLRIRKPDGEIVEIASLPGIKGDRGDKGDNGFSPTVQVSKSGKETTITITDANGTKTATIYDGEDGENGANASVTVDTELSDTSENPVQNKVIAETLYTANEVLTEIQREVESLKESGGAGGAEPLIGTTETITPAAVQTALAEGRQVVLSHTEEGAGEITFNAFAVLDDEMVAANATITMDGVVVNATLSGTVTEGTWSFAPSQLPSMDAMTPYLTPSVTEADNGKLLQVVGGVWAAVAITNGNEVAY